MLAAVARSARTRSCRSVISVRARWAHNEGEAPASEKEKEAPKEKAASGSAVPPPTQSKPLKPAQSVAKEASEAVKAALIKPSETPKAVSDKTPQPSAPASAAPIPAKPLRRVTLDPDERDFHATVVHGRGSLKPYQHPQTHGIPVALVHFRSFFPPLLPIFTNFALHAAASLGIPVSGVAALPTQRSLWTVPRGPFVHKKSQENFERKVHKRVVKAFDADPEVVDRWIKYLERHALAGVGIRVVRWHRVPVGVGRKQLESAVSRMRLEGPTDKEKVKALGQQIITEETKAAQGTTA